MGLDDAFGRQAGTCPPASLSPERLAGTLIWLQVLALAVLAVWTLMELPADVPDTSSPPFQTSSGTANDWTSVGQTFVPNRNGLEKVSVILAAEKLTDQAQITFNIKETPKGEPIRTVRRLVSELPVGEASRLRPGSLEERWETFEFDPIRDSAGRKLYFSIEGKGVPRENTVKVLMFYHNGYPQGEAYLNESAENANVVFRTYSQGRLIDLAGVIGANLIRTRPGILASPMTYLLLGMLYVVLGTLLIQRATRLQG